MTNQHKRNSFYRKAYAGYTELRLHCDARAGLVRDILMCVRELGLVVHMMLLCAAPSASHTRHQCEAVIQLADTGTTKSSTHQLDPEELHVLKHMMEYAINQKVGNTRSFLHGFSSTPEAMFSSGELFTRVSTTPTPPTGQHFWPGLGCRVRCARLIAARCTSVVGRRAREAPRAFAAARAGARGDEGAAEQASAGVRRAAHGMKRTCHTLA